MTLISTLGGGIMEFQGFEATLVFDVTSVLARLLRTQ